MGSSTLWYSICTEQPIIEIILMGKLVLILRLNHLLKASLYNTSIMQEKKTTTKKNLYLVYFILIKDKNKLK